MVLGNGLGIWTVNKWAWSKGRANPETAMERAMSVCRSYNGPDVIQSDRCECVPLFRVNLSNDSVLPNDYIDSYHRAMTTLGHSRSRAFEQSTATVILDRSTDKSNEPVYRWTARCAVLRLREPVSLGYPDAKRDTAEAAVKQRYAYGWMPVPRSSTSATLARLEALDGRGFTAAIQSRSIQQRRRLP